MDLTWFSSGSSNDVYETFVVRLKNKKKITTSHELVTLTGQINGSYDNFWLPGWGSYVVWTLGISGGGGLRSAHPPCAAPTPGAIGISETPTYGTIHSGISSESLSGRFQKKKRNWFLTTTTLFRGTAKWKSFMLAWIVHTQCQRTAKWAVVLPPSSFNFPRFKKEKISDLSLRKPCVPIGEKRAARS